MYAYILRYDGSTYTRVDSSKSGDDRRGSRYDEELDQPEFHRGNAAAGYNPNVSRRDSFVWKSPPIPRGKIPGYAGATGSTECLLDGRPCSCPKEVKKQSPAFRAWLQLGNSIVSECVTGVPSVFTGGYEKARADNPGLAGADVAHTMIGDHPADSAVESLAGLSSGQTHRFIQVGARVGRKASYVMRAGVARPVRGAEIAAGMAV